MKKVKLCCRANQNVVTAYVSSKKLLYFGIAEQYRISMQIYVTGSYAGKKIGEIIIEQIILK